MASDPKVYAAGLVSLFSHYPRHIVERAVDPFSGIPGQEDFTPTIAKVKAYLDPLARSESRRQELIERYHQPKLAPPPPDPAMREKMAAQLKDLSNHLKSGFGPSTL